jgi:hypothetical protein
MSAALFYELAAFAVVFVMVFFLRPPAQRQGHDRVAARPLAAES